MICSLHNVVMEEKTGEYGIWYSHTLAGVGYCNGKKITPFKNPANSAALAPTMAQNQPITREPIIDNTEQVITRQNHIERQHSQEMAIKALELMFKINPDIVEAGVTSKGLMENIKIYTDKFQEDIKSGD